MVKRKVILSAEEKIKDEEITDEYVEKFYLTNTQMKIIDTIYRLRVVDSKDLQKIINYKDLSGFTKLLKKLYLGRFLDRKFRPLELKLENKGSNGNRNLYYMLDIAGEKFIKKYYGIKETVWNKEQNLIQYNYAKHDIMASHVVAELLDCIRNTDLDIKIIDFIADKHLTIKYTVGGKKYIFRPDLFIRYIVNGVEKSTYFEIDMGTMIPLAKVGTSSVSFDKKVPHYENLMETIKDDIDFKNKNTVVVITTDIERAARLAKSVQIKKNQIQKDQAKFLFTTFEKWDKNPLSKCLIDKDFDKNNPVVKSFLE